MMGPSVLERCIERKAVIYAGEFHQTYAAYPLGDRRRRPIAWLDHKQLTQFVADGVLTRKKGSYHLNHSYIRRQKCAGHANAYAAQHRDMEDRDVYIAEGVKRSARMNRRLTPLRILARQKDADGRAFLSDAEIEAGERFARDYDMSHMAHISTQDYAALADSSGRRQVNGHEDVMAYQQDARSRVMAALSHLGAGLDRAIMAICAHELTLDNLERTERWAKHSGKTVLKLALQKLVTFYGTEPGAGVRT